MKNICISCKKESLEELAYYPQFPEGGVCKRCWLIMETSEISKNNRDNEFRSFWSGYLPSLLKKYFKESKQ